MLEELISVQVIQCKKTASTASMVFCCSSCLVFYKALGVLAIILFAMWKPIWHNFLQPAFANFWSASGKVEDQTDESPTAKSEDCKMSDPCCSPTSNQNGAMVGTVNSKKDD